MFTFDAISSIIWPDSFGFLDRGDGTYISQSDDGTIKIVHASLVAHLPLGVHDHLPG